MAEITGMDEMRAAMAGLDAKLAAELPGMVLQAAFMIESEIDARAPIDTGALKSSIDPVTSKREHSATATVQAEDSAVNGVEHYAIYQEFGTSTQPAQPFFRPGFAIAEPKARAMIEQQIAQVIDNYDR